MHTTTKVCQTFTAYCNYITKEMEMLSKIQRKIIKTHKTTANNTCGYVTVWVYASVEVF